MPTPVQDGIFLEQLKEGEDMISFPPSAWSTMQLLFPCRMMGGTIFQFAFWRNGVQLKSLTATWAET
jgi:hypothetical protein